VKQFRMQKKEIFAEGYPFSFENIYVMEKEIKNGDVMEL
jgi:hypothetical protein